MATCSNCGDTGRNPFECPALTSDVTWDGGALCTGFSSGDLNDALQHLATEICTLQTSVSAVSVVSDDVTLSTLAGSCFTVTTGGTLTDWVDEAESKICTLITDLAALDLTEPFYFDATGGTVTGSGTYVVIDTIAVPANTLNANGEYLQIEIFATADLTPTAACSYKVTFAGVNAAIFDMQTTLTYYGRNDVITFTRKSSNTLCVDWHGMAKRNKGVPSCDFEVESDISPVDFTVSNNITIEALKTTGTFTLVRTRILKANKS